MKFKKKLVRSNQRGSSFQVLIIGEFYMTKERFFFLVLYYDFILKPQLDSDCALHSLFADDTINKKNFTLKI